MPRRRRVLLVEDDRVLRRACQIGLERRGYYVVTAENGALGLAQATEHRFDVILLDMLMPVMSGLEMLSELRRLGVPTPPVLVLSNSSGIESRRAGEALGVAAYLVKADLSLETLAARVAGLTGSGE